MIDFVLGAAVNVAPATESTGASSAPPAEGACSFAELLDAAADDVTESASADESDEDIAAVNEWMTVPVFVPFVPILPTEDVVESQAPVATSADGIDDEDVSVATSVAVREDLTSIPLPAFLDGGTQPSMEKDQAKPATARESSAPESSAPEPSAPATPAPATPVVETPAVHVQAVQVPADEAQPIPVSTGAQQTAPKPSTAIEGDTPLASNESNASVKAPAAKPGKVARATSGPKVPDINEETKPANEVRNEAQSLVQSASEPAQAVAAATEKANGVEPSSKGLAVRLARALEHAVESSTTRQTAAGSGESGYSFNSHSDNQPSLGEWLREQLPQVAAGRGHAALNSTFSVAAPLQSEARVSGVLAAAGQPLTPAAPSLPSDHDVTLQIVQSLRMQFRDGIGEAVLRLKPEHLGSVSISLRVENGGLKASVQAEVPAVRQWLESQQDTLRTALAEQGLRLDRFDVEPDAQRQASPDDAQERQQRKRHARKRHQSEQPVFEVVV